MNKYIVGREIVHDLFYIYMSELGENSKVSNRLDEAVIKKISSLVTNFHSILLPKAKNSDVYRDLTE